MSKGGNSFLFPKLKQSQVFKVFYSTGTLESSSIWIKDVKGKGWGAEIGSKTYFNKNAFKGFYMANYITGGTIEFDKENIYDTSIFGGDGKFYGTYRYLSIFSPEIGYKFLIANTVAVNLHIGTSWLIEFKGKGDVDNKSFDNWVPRAWIAIGYNF